MFTDGFAFFLTAGLPDEVDDEISLDEVIENHARRNGLELPRTPSREDLQQRDPPPSESGSVSDDRPAADAPAIPSAPSSDPMSEAKPVSKSARVREFLEQHPEARNRDIAEALSSFGVTAADVANVKTQLKRKQKKAGRMVKPNAKTKPAAEASSTPASAPASPQLDATIQIDLLEAGVDFIRKAGGINEAQHVLGMIRRIQQL